MDVISQRSRILKRLALIAIGLVLVTSSVVAAMRYREWRNERAHRERLSVAKVAVKPGMSSMQVQKMLGKPTFVERDLSEMFRPKERECRQRSRSSLIYQALPERTLVVFFDEQNRVTCAETTTAFMIMHRAD